MEARLISRSGAASLSMTEIRDAAARDGGTLWLDFDHTDEESMALLGDLIDVRSSHLPRLVDPYRQPCQRPPRSETTPAKSSARKHPNSETTSHSPLPNVGPEVARRTTNIPLPANSLGRRPEGEVVATWPGGKGPREPSEQDQSPGRQPQRLAPRSALIVGVGYVGLEMAEAATLVDPTSLHSDTTLAIDFDDGDTKIISRISRSACGTSKRWLPSTGGGWRLAGLD